MHNVETQARCERCGKWVNEEEYYSLPNCNETGFGVCLCKTCYEYEESERQTEEYLEGFPYA